MLRTAWRSLCSGAIPSRERALQTCANSLPSAPSTLLRSALRLQLPPARLPPATPAFGAYRRPLCASAQAASDYHGDDRESSSAATATHMERVPLPPGLSNDKFGLYEVLESSQHLRQVQGRNAVVAIHGPTEAWIPKGIEQHGASGGMWAIIATSGTQYKVMKGDVLYTNRQVGEVNTQVAFDAVLAIGVFDWTLFGRPAIRHAKVLATVEEQTKSAKVMVAKFKKRKGYRRRKGHRQPITRFRIDDIVYEWPDAEMIKPYKVPFYPNRPPLPNHMRPL